MRRRRRPVFALALIVLSLGSLGVVGQTFDQPEAEAPETRGLAGTDAVSGRVVCAVGDDRPGTSAVVDVVRPGSAGDPPALAELRTIGDVTTETAPRLFPGSATRIQIESADTGDVAEADTDDAEEADTAGAEVTDTADAEAADVEDDADADEGDATTGDDDGAVDELELADVPRPVGAATDVRWSGAPVAVAREWRLEGEADLPPGTAAGPCVPGTAASSWTVPGLITSGGSEARLRIANPHPSGATVAVGFLTPEGPEEPTRLRNLSIDGDAVIELVVNDYLPEEQDLAAVVEVSSGRVAVEGVQLTRSAIGGIDGVSLLQPAAEPAEIWTVPLIIDGDDRASWLWIANQDDRSAPVELTLHTEGGGTVPEGLAEVAVPPGTVRRVDLRGTLPAGVTSAAVTARSGGVPVTVSGVAQIGGDDPDTTGFAVQLGAVSDDTWVLTGSGREGRSEQLRLVNPGSEPAVVEASLWTGAAATEPAELSGLEVPPGALLSVPVTELVQGASAWSLTVRSTGGELVAAMVGSGPPGGPRHLVAVTGAPSAWWSTPRDPVLRPAPGMTQRLGTELGIEPVDPLAPSSTGTDPSPTTPADEPVVPDAPTPPPAAPDDGAQGEAG